MLLKKLVVLGLPLIWLCAFSSYANQSDQRQQLDENYIERAILTTSVENREPVDDIGDQYTHSGNDFDRLTFFTHIINHDGRGIAHRWYHGDELDAEISLAVGSNSWRTYSSRQIGRMATGEWTVRVINDRDEELVVHHFVVQR
ncbi:MAG: DUF2914 domain-containing protein [Gammaproteobacteria bacterium]|nr:DUF2914 domain-containing protein [Gammaproteobacteria bacterium]